MFRTIKFLLIVLAICCTGCAKRGRITGGAKDTLVPVLRRSVPENGAINFSGKEIKLYFNEYVKLKDVAKQMIVSPPMKNAPEVLPYVASKTITIKLRDTLLANTTYSFNFGQSIEDNNENNPMPDFKYVFSTGPLIDSLKLKVAYRDAINRKNDKFVSIMLYEADENFNDSTIYRQQPRYITNSLDKDGVMEFENLKQGKYRLVAIKDENKNNRFDPKQDKIGFIKDIVTLPNDTLYELELFKEVLPFRVLKPSAPAANRALFPYEGRLKEASYQVRKAGQPIPFKVTKVPQRDSVQVWFAPIKNDSVTVGITQGARKFDFTVNVKDQKADTLAIAASPSGNLHFREKITLRPSTPLVKVDNSKIRLIDKDSANVAFTSQYDEWNQELVFDFEKQPSEKYTMVLAAGALTDFYEQSNKAAKFDFVTTSTAEYGNLKVILENVKRFPVIVELTDAEGKLMATAYSEKETVIDFNLVEPKKFTLRLIYDDDKNREWTPGSYPEKRLSEEVIYFPKEIDVRANWDVEQPFDLGK